MSWIKKFSLSPLSKAARALARGELVAFPTETVYGLGGNARMDSTVAQIFALKGRPTFNPLIVHVTDLAMALQYGDFTPSALTLAEAFWPGPLTLVVHRTQDCKASKLVSAGLDTVALRVPAHPIARQLLHRAACPVAAPSANKSGLLSPTTKAHVRASFTPKQLPFVLNGGHCAVGLESTVIDCVEDNPLLLRKGGIAREDIESCLGHKLSHDASKDAPARSPGLHGRHYQPRTPLRLMAKDKRANELLLAFGSKACKQATMNLSPTGDLVEAAANFFAMLHKLDAMAIACKATAIAVQPLPNRGLGEALNDRLTRAAMCA